jgi:hypothetical protein
MRLHQERTGEKFGSTKLVKAMLEPHRAGLDSKASARLNQILTRQDIEAWLNRGVEFSSVKFHFVDYYVQTLLKSGIGLELRNLVEESFTHEMCRILSELYVQENNDDYGNIARMLEGLAYSYVNPSGANSEKYLLSTKASHLEILVANVLTLQESDRPGSQDNRKIWHGEAYFVPMRASGSEAAGVEVSGVMFYRNPELHNRMSRTAKEDGLTLMRYSMSPRGIEISFPSRSIPFGMARTFMPRTVEDASVRLEQDIDPESGNLLRLYAGRVV